MLCMEYTTFDSMNLKEPLLRAIYAYGYEQPSIIQQRAIVPFLTGQDLIAQAQSGTGKGEKTYELHCPGDVCRLRPG